MPLPTPPVPYYELELPSNGKKVVYRPYLTKEEKILLIALESQDEKQVISAIKNTIKSCLKTKIKIEDLATFDIEYLFLNIRARSIGEYIELLVTCPDDNTTQIKVKIDIDQIKVQKDPKHQREFKLSDDFIVTLKYPNIDSVLEADKESADEAMKVFAKCVAQIATPDEVYDCSKYPIEEVQDFLEKLQPKDFEKLETFFATIPKLSHTIKFRNPNTEVENEVTIEGVFNFFA